jgi:hypothetical protein
MDKNPMIKGNNPDISELRLKINKNNLFLKLR